MAAAGSGRGYDLHLRGAISGDPQGLDAGHELMNRIRDYISDGKIQTAVNLCKKTDTPIARMIEKGIERIGRPMSDVQTAIENVANLEVSNSKTAFPFWPRSPAARR